MGKHSKHSGHSKRSKEVRGKGNITKKLTLQNCLLTIFIIIFIVSGAILLNWYISTGNSEKKYEELASEVISTDNQQSVIDFEKLRETNSDVVAWIEIDGTTINYPVMKTTDNSYYLTNNFYKEYDRCGSLFMDYKSSFTDKNIVIYGHNIKRGIMFADLENVCNGSLGNDIDVNIYMPDKTMKFKVFSSYSIDPEDYSINTSITENEFDEFKQTLSKRSKIDFVSDYNGSNQILTLSTCDRSGKRRVLVHASLEEVNYISNT